MIWGRYLLTSAGGKHTNCYEKVPLKMCLVSADVLHFLLDSASGIWYIPYVEDIDYGTYRVDSESFVLLL